MSHIVLACATRRGLVFLRELIALVPGVRLTVFSFREEPHEPPFLDEIRTTALAAGADFHETRNVGHQRFAGVWDAKPDLMLLVSWRYMVSREVYERPSRGTYVFHDSLLPRYRGFAPTVWAIANGEFKTGVTLFRIAETVDSGPIVAQEAVTIGPDDTIGAVIDRVTDTYTHVLRSALPGLLDGTASAQPQDESQATYTCKRTLADNLLDFQWPTDRIYNLIRAATRPYPGAFTFLDGRKITIWQAERLPSLPDYVGRVPGRVVQIQPGRGTVVLTGDGALLITEVQVEGEEPSTAATVLNNLGYTLSRA